MALTKVTFTKHARERLEERYFKLEYVEQAVWHPDSVRPGKKPNTFEYIKKFDAKKVTVILTKIGANEVLVLSNWIDPPYFGTTDYKKNAKYKKYKNATMLQRIIYDLLGIFGL